MTPYDMDNEVREPSNTSTRQSPTPLHDNGSKPSLKKVLGIPDGIAILIGCTIGAGIYSNPQLIAGYLGSFSSIMLLWLGAGVLVFSFGFIYAELGTRMPQTGGEYVYIVRTLGPFAGFMFGWGQLFMIRTSAAAGLALITADYMGFYFRLNEVTHMLVALSVIALFGVLNYIGIEKASIYQKTSTLFKVAGLASLAVIGVLLSGGQENLLSTRATPTGELGPIGNVVAAMMLVLFAHTGWERVGYVAGEMKNPRRVVPPSLLVGIVTVVILYATTNTIYHWTLGMEGMRNSTIVAADTLVVLIGPAGGAVIAFLVIMSTTGSINGTMMTATRVYYAMARDGLFFNWLNYIHPRFRTPSRAIVVHCLWAAVILFVRGSFETIISGMVFIILIFFALTTVALFVMRRKSVGGTDVFLVPFYPLLPILTLVTIVGLIVLRAWFEWQNSITDLAFILTGIPFALYWCRRRKPGSLDTGSAQILNDT